MPPTNVRHNYNDYFGWCGQGKEVEALEQELLRFSLDDACAVVSSGSAALYLASRALALNSLGRPITIPTYACVSLYSALRLRGIHGAVQLLDSDPYTFGADGVISVDVYGVPSKSRSPAALISDITHSIGGTDDGEPCGSWAEVAVASFGATKMLGAGQGGCILGPRNLIDYIKSIRDYDGNPDGFNFQLSDVMAKMVRKRLRGLDQDNAQRQRTASRYLTAIDGRFKVHGAEIPGRTWYRFVLQFDSMIQRDAAQRHFTECGIETIVPIRTDELIHRKLGLSPDGFPNAEKIAQTTLSLPIWPRMVEEDVRQVELALKLLKV